jgi:actin related protein 2/3 complex subunit 1A/1B
MAYFLDISDTAITCHAWSPDGSQLALCPNTTDLEIYEISGRDFNLLHTLTGHNQRINSVDWSARNQIVTCSDDANAYVWSFDTEKNIWRPGIVFLALNRAATYVRWAPDGEKFVVATGSNKLRVCEFVPRQNLWRSLIINHERPTALTAEFLPDNVHVVASGTDRQCRYATTDEDQARVTRLPNGMKKKDFIIRSFWSQGWTNASAVSPSGVWVAFTSQDSYIRFVRNDELEDPRAPARSLNLTGLPLLSLAFLSDAVLVGGGFDCQPRLFNFSGAEWEDIGLIDIPEIRERAAPGGGAGGLAARAAAFGGRAVTISETIHSNVINGIRVTGRVFTTCSNDGRIGIWPFSAISDHFGGKVRL